MRRARTCGSAGCRSGVVPRRVFDVQIAAGLVGFGYPLSLGNLVYQALKISLLGGETRTDWRRRPLSDAQLRYALEDVRHLLELADRLEADLQRLGRIEWAEDEFASFLDGIENRGEEERWRKLSGLHMLNRRGLETARRLSGLAARGRQEGRTGRSGASSAMTCWSRSPSGSRPLDATSKPSATSTARNSCARANEILAVIAEAQERRRREPPRAGRAARRPARPGDGRQPALGHPLAGRRPREGRRRPGSAAPSDLKDLVRWYLDGQPEARTPELLEGWRREVCGKTLLDVLSGRRGAPDRRPPGRGPRGPRPDLQLRRVDGRVIRGEVSPMRRIVSCYSNCFGPSGVRAAVEGLAEVGIGHVELALRGHDFGGLVIPESAVITEKTDPAAVAEFLDLLKARTIQVSGCNVGGGDLRTVEGFEITAARMRFASRTFGATLAISGAGQPSNPGERTVVVEHLRTLGDLADDLGMDLALETHKGPTQNADAMLALMARGRPSPGPAQFRYRQYRLLQPRCRPGS